MSGGDEAVFITERPKAGSTHPPMRNYRTETFDRAARFVAIIAPLLLVFACTSSPRTNGAPKATHPSHIKATQTMWSCGGPQGVYVQAGSRTYRYRENCSGTLAANPSPPVQLHVGSHATIRGRSVSLGKLTSEGSAVLLRGRVITGVRPGVATVFSSHGTHCGFVPPKPSAPCPIVDVRVSAN